MLAPFQHTNTVAVEDARLRELPDGWVWTTIGSVTENFDGRRVPVKARDRAAMRGPYPYYGASGVIDSVDSYLFDGTYLLITEDGVPLSQSKGIAFLASGKFWVNNHAHVVKALGDLPLEYLKACANSANLQGYVTGTTRLKLTQAALNSIPLPLAPLAEQRRIVAEIEKQFTRLDAFVAALKRVQANLKRYRASVLKAACEGRLVPTEAELAQTEGRHYEPADRLLARILSERRTRWESQEKRGRKYKEPVAPDTSNLSELPEGWVWATVEQLASLEPNSITDGPFGSNLKTSHYTQEGPRVIRLQNIGNGQFIDAYAHISRNHYRKLTKHKVKAGDLVIAALGKELPRSCLVPSTVGPAIVKADCIRFRPAENLALPAYLNIALNTEHTRKRTAGIVHGVGRPRLNLREIRGLTLPLPPFAEQHRIVAEVDRRLSVIQQAEAAVEANLARADRLRQSILKQAFSGQLVPQDPSAEPASVLLERIRAEREAAQAAAKSKRKPRRRARPRTEPALQEGGS